MKLHTSLVPAAAAALFASVSAGTVSLPSYPLAVKSPYLSTWVPGDQITDAATAEPQFWAGQDLTWPILARVNGQVYSLFGLSAGATNVEAATTNSVYYTSSHTVIELTAGSANVILDFFSPVLPGTADYAKQSLPYSYLTVAAKSASSSSVTVDVLTGIDQTWTAQGGASTLTYTTAGSTGYFTWFNADQILFTESDDQATYGSWVLGATTSGSNTTRTCAAQASVISSFVSAGTLTAASACGGDNLAAFATTLGSVGSTYTNVTYTVGFDRTNTINYLGAVQTGYYRSVWSSVAAAVEYVLGSYSTIVATSYTLDSEVRAKAQAASTSWGSEYADIVEASVRQTFGAIELTVPIDDLTATPSVFLKEISSDGNVNTVDVIYQSWPIFVSLNPSYIRFLFQPILSLLEQGPSQWPHPWVIHDIGSDYPNATGHADGVAEEMPLFETSTLFIMLYTYEKYSGNTTWTTQYTTLLQGYADYLVENSLYPASQLISVDAIAATANQSALAVQSVIGIKAAAKVLGNATLATIADEYAYKLYNESLALNGDTLASSTHFTYNYGSTTTWNVLFAAYSDVLLGLDTFPSSAWALQSTWYESQIQTEGLPFAGPVTDLAYVGTGITWGLSDWNIVAAAASSTTVQAAVINTTHTYLTNGLNTVPFGTKYYVEGADVGVWIANKARSTVGSNFAILALQEGTWGTTI